MNEESPDMPLLYDSEDMNSLVRRLGEAGWLQGDQIVDKNGFFIRYSKKGSEGMRSIGNVLETHAPGCLDGAPTKPAPATPHWIIKVMMAAPELFLPFCGLSDGEGNAFVGLIAAYHRQFGSDSPPEDSPPTPPRF